MLLRLGLLLFFPAFASIAMSTESDATTPTSPVMSSGRSHDFYQSVENRSDRGITLGAHDKKSKAYFPPAMAPAIHFRSVSEPVYQPARVESSSFGNYYPVRAPPHLI